MSTNRALPVGERVFAQILDDEIQNIAIFDNYEDANYLTRATYGDNAFAVYCNRYCVGFGDKYIDGVFYYPDGVTPAEYIPTEAENIATLQYESANMKSTYAPVMTLARMQAVTLSDEQALLVPELFARWKKDTNYKLNERIRYNNILYKVINEHTSQETWTPDVSSTLYTPIGTPEQGTKDNPIVWVTGMESYKDKYYIDEEILYIGLENSGIGLYGTPKDLVRYFKVVEE